MSEAEVPRGVLQQQHRLPAQPDLEVEGDAAAGSNPRRRQRAGRPDQRRGAHRKLPAGAAAGAEGSGTEGERRVPRRKVCRRPGGAGRVPPRSFREVPPSSSRVKMARGGAEDRRGCRQEKAARETRRVRGGARPSAAEVVPPLRLLALCGGGTGRALCRDGPAAQLGRAGLGRAAPLRHQTAAASPQAAGADQPTRGRLVPSRRGFVSALSGLPTRPSQWAAARRASPSAVTRRWAVPQSRLHPASTGPLRPPRPQVEAEPEESGFSLASRQHGGFSRAGWRQLPPRTERSASGAGAPAWPRLFCLASAGRFGQLRAASSSSPRRFWGRSKAQLAPISSLNQLPVSGTV